MDVKNVRKDFDNNVLAASFSALGPAIHHGRSPSVHVYAYKARDGYLWAFMEGDIMAEGSNVIKDGGRTRSYRDAVDNAVERLMLRVDR